jgi:hypothetical protein
VPLEPANTLPRGLLPWERHLVTRSIERVSGQATTASANQLWRSIGPLSYGYLLIAAVWGLAGGLIALFVVLPLFFVNSPAVVWIKVVAFFFSATAEVIAATRWWRHRATRLVGGQMPDR